MRNTLNEEKLKDKFDGGDKNMFEQAVQETLDWLDKNQLAEDDVFEGLIMIKGDVECEDLRPNGIVYTIFEA